MRLLVEIPSGVPSSMARENGIAFLPLGLGTGELMLKATVTPKPERAGTQTQPDRGSAVNTQPSDPSGNFGMGQAAQRQ